MMTYSILKQHCSTISQLWAIEVPAFGMEATTSIRNYDRVEGLS